MARSVGGGLNLGLGKDINDYSSPSHLCSTGA